MERFKSFLKLIAYCTALVLIFIYAWNAFSNSYDLAQNGKISIAKVIDYKLEETTGRKGRTRTHHLHLLYFDNQTEWVDLHKTYEINTRLNIIYSSKNPSNITFGNSKLSTLEYFKNDIGIIGLIVGIIVMIFIAFEITNQFRKTINPPPPPKLSNSQKNEILLEQQHAKSRISAPIKSAAIFASIAFCIALYLSNSNNFSEQVVASVIVAFITFCFSYILLYKPAERRK
mgnify:CR=1 FL=1